jgi:heme exporter protein C
MFKNFLPNKILSLDNKLINNLVSLMIVILIIGFVYAIFISPPDYIQGDSVRIMYVHVPSSFISLGCFALIGIASILNLIFKIKYMPLVAKSLAPIGAVFTFISIATGSLWGKPTWGIWWVWDARLTSMVILFFFYISYIATWKFITNYDKAIKLSTIIAIMGLFNLPVIKYSVDWWNTLHQPSSITLTSAPTIHYTMLFPLLIMFLGLIVFSLVIFLMKYKSELIKLKISNKKNRK